MVIRVVKGAEIRLAGGQGNQGTRPVLYVNIKDIGGMIALRMLLPSSR